MKITELLIENQEQKKPKKPVSNLPSAAKAASIDDNIEDELVDIDDLNTDIEDEEDDESEGIELFKKHAADMGKDLYSLGMDNSTNSKNFTLNILSDISKTLPTVTKRAVNLLKNAGEDGAIEALILNARTGDVMMYELSDMGSVNLTGSEGDDFQTLVDQDQANLLNKLLKASEVYVNAEDKYHGRKIGQDKISNARDKVLDILNISSQPFHAPEHTRRGFSNEKAYLKDKKKQDDWWNKHKDDAADWFKTQNKTRAKR